MCTLLDNPQKKCALLKIFKIESTPFAMSTPGSARALCARDCTPRPADVLPESAEIFMDFEQKLKYIYALVLDPIRSIHAQYTLNTVGRTSVVGCLSDKDIILHHSIFTYNSHHASW